MGLITEFEKRAQRFLIKEETPVSHWWIWFGAITLLGTILRFWDLGGAPIWMDEAVTLAFARLDFGTIMWGNIDNHPNLTWMIQKLWYSINPDPAHARVPVALFGSLSVAAILLATRDVASARAAIFTGLLFAVATCHIYYSQDARMYAYLIFGLILAVWGGIGHVRPRLCSPRMYAALYVLGGSIAIYSHAIGLIAMGMIGFASLAAGLYGDARHRFARDWFVRNLILFVITLPWLVALPSASGTFPGIIGDNSITDSVWFFRNATGFPGLDKLSLPFEAIYYGLSILAVPIALINGRRELAFVLLGLILLYPAAMLIMHLRQPLLINRIFLPGLIGITIGVGYALSRLRPMLIASIVAGCLALASFGSTVTELKYHIKLEDYSGAYAYASEQGVGDAPALTCVHFQAAAAWENRPDGRTLYYRDGAIIDYKGPEYWQAAKMSMPKLRIADAHEIDAVLGGGWLIEGGMKAALSNDNEVLFIRAFCDPGREAHIDTELEALGFQEGQETLITGNAADFVILENPQTRITIYRR